MSKATDRAAAEEVQPLADPAMLLLMAALFDRFAEDRLSDRCTPWPSVDSPRIAVTA